MIVLAFPLIPSASPFVSPVLMYSRTPSICFRIVLPTLTNESKRERAAQSSHSLRRCRAMRPVLWSRM